jgi:hypothetical protein
MKKVSTITAKNGKKFIEIFESNNSIFTFKMFVVRYDDEEDVEYTIECDSADLSSKFGDLASAEEEAKRLMRIAFGGE